MNGTTDSSRPGFFGVVIDPQSHVNMAYLLLAFPLGTAYFIFLVTGLSVGSGLTITLVGIPMVFISVHVMNVMASLSGGLARVMPGKAQGVASV